MMAIEITCLFIPPIFSLTLTFAFVFIFAYENIIRNYRIDKRKRKSNKSKVIDESPKKRNNKDQKIFSHPGYKVPILAVLYILSYFDGEVILTQKSMPHVSCRRHTSLV